MSSQGSSRRAKIGVLVVHGVGNPKKGGTLNEFAQGLTGMANRRDRDVPVEFHDSHIVVSTPTAQQPDAVYEAPARRFGIGDTDYLAAEMFWGDLSQIKPGVFNLLRGLFDLLYGLPGIIRHMLDEAGSFQRGASYRWYRLVLLLSVTVITGPILALETLSLAAILLSAGVNASKQILFESSEQCTVGTCLQYDALFFLLGFLLVGIVAGRLRHWFVRQQWSRLTLIYLFYFCIAASLLMLLSLLSNWYSPYALFQVMPLSIVVLWIGAALVNGIAVVLLLIVRSFSHRSRNNGVTASFILTQLSFCLWALLSAGLFYITFKFLPASYHNDYLAHVCSNCDVFSFATNEPATDANIPIDIVRLLIMPFLVLIMTAAVFAWARFSGSANRQQPARLIIPDSLYRWMLGFTIAIVLVLMYLGWILATNNYVDTIRTPAFIDEISMALLAGMIVMIAMFREHIHHGLDIGLDVANYWRADRVGILAEALPGSMRGIRELSRQHLHGVMDRLSRTDRVLAGLDIFASAAERSRDDISSQTEIPLTRYGDDITGFYKRYHMRVRFIATLKALVAERPDHLLILCHSQGTMVAIDGLRHLASGRAAQPHGIEEPLAERAHLVTMGSPYQHLYQYYFPQSHAPDPFVNARPVQSWLNIYRSDDYIGREIAGPGEAISNRQVGARGHTGYWRDREVLQHLLHHLEQAGVKPA